MLLKASLVNNALQYMTLSLATIVLESGGNEM